jgi:hypothetical protein
MVILGRRELRALKGGKFKRHANPDRYQLMGIIAHVRLDDKRNRLIIRVRNGKRLSGGDWKQTWIRRVRIDLTKCVITREGTGYLLRVGELLFILTPES